MPGAGCASSCLLRQAQRTTLRKSAFRCMLGYKLAARSGITAQGCDICTGDAVPHGSRHIKYVVSCVCDARSPGSLFPWALHAKSSRDYALTVTMALRQGARGLSTALRLSQAAARGVRFQNRSVAAALAAGWAPMPFGLQVSTSAIRWQAEGAAAVAAEEPTNATAKQGWGQTKITDILKQKVL